MAAIMDFPHSNISGNDQLLPPVYLLGHCPPVFPNDLFKGAKKNSPKTLGWRQDAERSFLAIKRQLVLITRLSNPIPHARTVLYTDVSPEAMVLPQDAAGELLLVAFFSKPSAPTVTLTGSFWLYMR